MNLPFYIARRYFVSKKKQNIINIISGISLMGIMVGTMALVIVLSVVNGFGTIINRFFNEFDPDLKISSVEGKMFNSADVDTNKIKSIPGVIYYAEVIEEVAMIKYRSQQYFATVKGVPANYSKYTHIDSLIVEGSFTLESEGINYAVLGQGVAYNLGVGLTFIDPIRIIVPKKGRQIANYPAQSINHNYIYPSGIFSILEEVDSKYIIVPFQFAKDLFESGNQVSAIELGLNPNYSVKEIQEEVIQIVGNEFHVENKYQQHDLINKTIKSEKWASYLILVFILLIASFNIISSLSMLIIDKKEDIIILKSMGATSKLIRRIFLFEGWFISFWGAIIGATLGIFVCWLQIKYEFITLPGNGSFVISAYPVKIVFSDILFILGVVLLIGIFASWYPIKFISKKYLLSNNE